jgi:hypothetical protein
MPLATWVRLALWMLLGAAIYRLYGSRTPAALAAAALAAAAAAAGSAAAGGGGGLGWGQDAPGAAAYGRLPGSLAGRAAGADGA